MQSNDPKDLKELNDRIFKNTYIVGFGIDTTMHHACPACGFPDWLEWCIYRSVMDGYAAVTKPCKCKGCKRTIKQNITETAHSSTLSLELVDGPDLPEWFKTLDAQHIIDKRVKKD